MLRSTQIGIVAMLAWLSGCATYSPTGREYRLPSTGVKVTLPSGWLHYTPQRDSFVITRDGLRLERVTISATRCGKKIAGTEKVISPGLLPIELAEISMGLLQSQETVKNLNTQNIELANVAGQPGYRIDAVFVDEHGLPMRMRSYGAIIVDGACEFRLIAAEPVYFEKYLPALEELVASARIGR